MSWWERIFHRRHLHDELAEEMREHIEEKTEQLMRLENLSQEQARAAALRAFGNPTLAQTRSREVWQWPRLESLLVDLKLALRRLRRSPGFASTVLLTLAIGVGANTAVFTVMESVLFKPLSYPQSDRLMGVWYKAPGVSIPKLGIAPYLYFIDREQSKTLEDIGMVAAGFYSMTGGAQPERVPALQVTDGTLPILGVQPVYGRFFTRRDDLPNMPKTAIVTYGFWQRHFGGDPSAVGRVLRLNGQIYEIIGVLPKGFSFPEQEQAEVLVPMELNRSQTPLGGFIYTAIARLKPDVTLEEASTDLQRLIPVANHSFPPPSGFSLAFFERANFAVDLHPLKSDVIGDVGNVLWVLMGSIVIMLLVACANVVNLMLVRVEGRRQELAVRSALGANRKNIVVGLLLESLVIACVGSVIGLALAFGALRLLIAAAPIGLPRLHEIGIDLPVLLFTLGLALFVSLAISMIPMLKYSGITAGTGLREGGRGLSQSRERHRARNALVVVQVALALVLLICSVLMIRTFRALVHVSPGFSDPNSLESFGIYIPESQIPDTHREQVLRAEQAIVEQIAAIPGVSAVGLTTNVPMSGTLDPNPIYARDHTYTQGELAPVRSNKFVSPGYFSTMGIPLIAGRDITWPEEYEKRPVVIISENFAREYWGSPANAIGKLIHIGSTDPWHEIIGVAGDVYDDGVSKDPPASAYWPLFHDNLIIPGEGVKRYVSFVVRSPKAGSASFLGEVERAVWSVDRDLPLANTTTVGALYNKSMARTSFTVVMLCVAGIMTLLLGIIGIYGVISYAVSQRTHEIGIRLALGAPKRELRWMFVRSALVLTGIGVVIGLGAAAAVARLMRTLLFGVSPFDPLSFAAVPLILVAAAALASFLPACRVAGVNPVDALRAE
jgi:predicted permease